LLGTSKYQVVAEVMNLRGEWVMGVSYNCTIVCCTKQNHKRSCFVALTGVTWNVHEWMLIRSSNSSNLSKLRVNFLHLRLLKHQPHPPFSWTCNQELSALWASNQELSLWAINLCNWYISDFHILCETLELCLLPPAKKIKI
jgi:hypothetical protein